MNQIVSIIVGLIFSFIVYLAICQKGFLVGYVLNLVYGFVSYFLQNENPEITIIIIAGIILITALITLLEYIGCQKTQSFVGYVAYVITILVVIVVIVYLTKALFTFLADPSVLFNK